MTSLEKSVDAKIEEKIDAKIEKKFSFLEDEDRNREKRKYRVKWKDLGRKRNKRKAKICSERKQGRGHRIQKDSEEKDVRAVMEETIRVTGMKEVEYSIDCAAIPITRASVEFRNSKIRDRYVRSANMQRTQLDGRYIKISPALDVEETFHQKRLGIHQICTTRETQNSCARNTNEL